MAAQPIRAPPAVHGARTAALRDHFVGLLLANLAADDVALPDPHRDPRPPAPRAVPRADRRRDAPERLARLARDTPVFVAGEASDWLRMHALARDELRARFAELPAAEQADAARARAALARRSRACSRMRRATRSPPASARWPTTWPSAACTNR